MTRMSNDVALCAPQTPRQANSPRSPLSYLVCLIIGSVITLPHAVLHSSPPPPPKLNPGYDTAGNHFSQSKARTAQLLAQVGHIMKQPRQCAMNSLTQKNYRKTIFNSKINKQILMGIYNYLVMNWMNTLS